MIIDHQLLSPETFTALLESYITREGTDYGEYEKSLNEKRLELQTQIIKGEVLIVFDEASQTINLMTKQALKQYEVSFTQP